MTKTYFASDPHFGHSNAVLTFKRPDGSPLRDFKDAEEMDEYMVDQWNTTVADGDRVYLLGDCVINKKFLPQLERLKGRIVLTMGNHDIFKAEKYPFEIRGYIVKPKAAFIAAHIPLHPDCVDRFELNIHGHLHYNVINDPRYINVSMEQIQYKPISLDDIFKRVEANKKSFEETGKVINWADVSRKV